MLETISNTSPLQYLHRIDKFQLLRQLYGEVTVPNAVYEELLVVKKKGINLPDLVSYNWIHIHKAIDDIVFTQEMGRGEQEALYIARANANTRLIIDDSLARSYAEIYHLNYTGTLGVLLKARQTGQITAIRPEIEQLKALGFRMTERTIDKILQLTKEL